MIGCALEPSICTAIKLYCIKVGDDLLADQLTPRDWSNLTNIHSFLLAFYEVTKAIEGRSKTLETVLPLIDYLLERLEAGKEEFANDPFMQARINSSWSKLNKYYGLTDRTPIYIAAIVLVPSLKWSYFEGNWDSSWVSNAKKEVLELWTSSYKGTGIELPVLDDKPLAGFAKWKAEKAKQGPIADEYARYCQSALCPVEVDARSWWLESTQRATYPNLSIMAFDMLSIPAMSAEPERLFSGAGITITDRRNRLSGSSIKALECLKSWLGSTVR